jgi:hypothetical protein
MKKLYAILTGGFISLGAFAQNQAQSSPAQPVVPPNKPIVSAFNKASCVLGMAVKDSEGKNLGKVQDLVFDLEKNQLSYAIVALAGDRLVPVPIRALRPVEGQDHFVLNISANLLTAAPGVAHDSWPDLDAFAVGAPAGSETGKASSARADEERQ